MAPKKKIDTNEAINFYRELPPQLCPKYHNPHADELKIKHPFFAGIFGGTGSGKTNTLFNLLKRMNGTFQKIILCVKTKHEPLYIWLESKLSPDQLEIYENGVVPDVDKFRDYDQQILVIFDDLVNMKNQRPIEEFYLRGRKLKKGCSMIYLSQSFYKTPKFIRIQLTLIILKRLTSSRDLNMIVSEFGMMGNRDKIIKAYKDITGESKEAFFVIRVDQNPEHRFSKNWTEFLDLE